MTLPTTASAYQRSLYLFPILSLNFFLGDPLVSLAFFTTGSRGDLIIIAGNERILLPYHAIQDILSNWYDVPLILPGGMIDAESRVSPHLRSHTIFFILQGRIYSTRWCDFAEVALGIVQYAPLVLLPGRSGP
jgi:hypothetical protein